jgi:hypothetical protein
MTARVFHLKQGFPSISLDFPQEKPQEKRRSAGSAGI